MPSCAFLKCKNNNRNRNKSLGITFHTFPRDIEMRKSWIDIIRISRRDEEWEANQFSRICSNHFDESDIYLTSKGFRKIKKTATPFFQELQNTTKIFLPPSSPNNSIVSTSTTTSVINKTQKNEFFKKIDRLTRENKTCKRKIKSLRKKKNILQQYNLLLKSSLQDLKKKTLSPDEYPGLALELKNMNNKQMGKRKIFHRGKGKLKKTRYAPSLKKFASTINFYSPAAYKYVRRVFGLVITRPHNFSYWLDNVRQRPDLLVKHFKA